MIHELFFVFFKTRTVLKIVYGPILKIDARILKTWKSREISFERQSLRKTFYGQIHLGFVQQNII
jgi:hypothetical protein